jgi:hypothetical protein
MMHQCVLPRIIALLLLCLLSVPAHASTIFIPAHATMALRDFAEIFALPTMNAHEELIKHSVFLTLLPASTFVVSRDPVLLQLADLCQIDLQHLEARGRQQLVAVCSWSPSVSSGHFVALESNQPTSSQPTSSAFAVFGTSIKHLRDNLTWLMRRVLLQPGGAHHGWIDQSLPLEPWTSLRSTQLPVSMVTMPMPVLQQ